MDEVLFLACRQAFHCFLVFLSVCVRKYGEGMGERYETPLKCTPFLKVEHAKLVNFLHSIYCIKVVLMRSLADAGSSPCMEIL